MKMPDKELPDSFIGQPDAAPSSDVDWWMNQQNELDMKAEIPKETNVVAIKKEFAPRQIVPQEDMPLADIYFSKFIRDSEAYMVANMDQQWLIDQILPMDAFGIIFGPSGAYKSFIGLDIAACVANQKDWHGYDVDHSGLVIYMAGEGARGLNIRHIAWMRKYGIKSDQLYILPMAIQADDRACVEALSSAVMRVEEETGKKARLIIVDTLARSMQGDENKAQDMGAFIRGCDNWRQDLGGCTVLVVAHTGYDQTHARGSTALISACDVSYKIISKARGSTTLSFAKIKDEDKPLDMIFSLEKTSINMNDSKGREIFSLVPFLQDRGSEEDERQEDEDDGDSPSDGQDLRALVGIVRAAQREMRNITLEELRDEYKKYRESNGVSAATIRKGWSRHFKKAVEMKQVFQESKFIFMCKGATM